MNIIEVHKGQQVIDDREIRITKQLPIIDDGTDLSVMVEMSDLMYSDGIKVALALILGLPQGTLETIYQELYKLFNEEHDGRDKK